MIWISSSASSCTSGLGYAPASLCERVVGVVGRFEFHMAVHPLRVAACLAMATLPQQVPALQRAVPGQTCFLIEPEGQDDKRDLTAERASLIDATRSYSTARRVAPIWIIPT